MRSAGRGQPGTRGPGGSAVVSLVTRRQSRWPVVESSPARSQRRKAHGHGRQGHRRSSGATLLSTCPHGWDVLAEAIRSNLVHLRGNYPHGQPGNGSGPRASTGVDAQLCPELEAACATFAGEARLLPPSCSSTWENRRRRRRPRPSRVQTLDGARPCAGTRGAVPYATVRLLEPERLHQRQPRRVESTGVVYDGPVLSVAS